MKAGTITHSYLTFRWRSGWRNCKNSWNCKAVAVTPARGNKLLSSASAKPIGLLTLCFIDLAKL